MSRPEIETNVASQFELISGDLNDLDDVNDMNDAKTHPAGKIKVAAARLIGQRTAAMAGLVTGAGMIGASTVLDHTTPSL